jgi:hypothetical protein
MGQKKLIEVYCLDTSALLDLKHRYPQDMPTFAPIWKRLDEIVNNDQLISHSQVYKEIKHVRDEIYKWCRQRKKIFRSTNKEQIEALKKVQTKYESDYYSNNLNKTGSWADPWVVSLAICEDAIVVADENNQINKIPYICQSVDVRCLDLVKFLRELGL